MKKRFGWLKCATATVVLAALIACMPTLALAADGSDDAEYKVAASSDYTDWEEIGRAGMVDVLPSAIPEGTYDIAAKTNSTMFDVSNCRLTVADGKMTAELIVSGAYYDAIYLGKAQDALKADSSECIAVVAHDDGTHSYTFDVPAINRNIDIAAQSKDKHLWYNFNVILLPESLPEGILKAGDWADEIDDPFDLESAQTDLDDGVYTFEVVVGGADDGLSVATPAYVKIEGGRTVVSLEWSNQDFDYMVVDGGKYLPVTQNDIDYFEVPIAAFDKPLDVIVNSPSSGEASYTLTFKSDTAELASSGVHISTRALVFAVVVIALIIVFLIYWRFRGTRRRISR